MTKDPLTKVKESGARPRGSRIGPPSPALLSGNGVVCDAQKTRKLGETEIVEVPTLGPHAGPQQNGQPLARLSM